jgi:hypothetical protein
MEEIVPPLIEEIVPPSIEEIIPPEVEIIPPEVEIIPPEVVGEIVPPEEVEEIVPPPVKPKKKKKKKQKHELLVTNPPTKEYMPEDRVLWRDDQTGHEHNGMIYKLWWGAEEYPSVQAEDIGKMLVEVYDHTAPPQPGEAQTKIVQGNDILAWLSREEEQAMDEGVEDWIYEDYEGPKLMLGDLVYVPGYNRPTVIEYISTTDTYLQALESGWGESIRSIPRERSSLEDVTVVVFGVGKRANDIIPVSGSTFEEGDIVEWVKEANIIEKFFGTQPANFAEIKKIIFTEKPNLPINRAPWDFKTHYKVVVNMGGVEKEVEGFTLFPLTDEGVPTVAIEIDVLRVGDKIFYEPGEYGEFRQEAGTVKTIELLETVLVDSLDPDNVASVVKPISEIPWSRIRDVQVVVQSEEDKSEDVEVKGRYIIGPYFEIVPPSTGIDDFQKEQIPVPPPAPPRPKNIFESVIDLFNSYYDERKEHAGPLKPDVMTPVSFECNQCGKKIPIDSKACQHCKAPGPAAEDLGA